MGFFGGNGNGQPVAKAAAFTGNSHQVGVNGRLYTLENRCRRGSALVR